MEEEAAEEEEEEEEEVTEEKEEEEAEAEEEEEEEAEAEAEEEEEEEEEAADPAARRISRQRNSQTTQSPPTARTGTTSGAYASRSWMTSSGSHGRVQVEPMEPVLKPSGTMCLYLT